VTALVRTPRYDDGAMIPSIAPLPIDAHIGRIIEAVGRHRAVIVTAAPGAGKTTRVPPALAEHGPVIVLQPRRVAARATAARVADERGWTVGREVGWHVRFERRFTVDTRVLFATEGILTARLQDDPLIGGFRTVVLDEFHERSLYADVGLALVKQAWRARSDLRIVVMSATIDATRVSAFLDDCPIIDAPGRVFPIEIAHAPGQTVVDAVTELLPRTAGAMLCFLPGAPEIRRAASALEPVLARQSVRMLPLHGGLDADAQDAAIRSSSDRRVILATNLAETTVTVPDVAVVIDTGTHKVARYDANRGIDSLEVERISLDSADQRAGRAGRTQAGLVRRLWDARDRLEPHREPEIYRVDLASTALDILGWGGDPRTMDWLDAPSTDALDAAFALLQRLGAVDDGHQMTPEGRVIHRLPLHPRLARVLLAAHGARDAARACALLAERHFAPSRPRTTTCDLLAAVESGLPWHIERAAGEMAESARRVLGPAWRESIDEAGFRRAVLAGYPDRVARRRAPRSDRFLLASGAGATQSRDSGVLDAEFIVAVDVGAGAAGAGGEARVRLATQVEREWLEPTSVDVRHEYDPATETVRATRIDLYGRVPLAERIVPSDPERAAPLLAMAFLKRGLGERERQLECRARFAGVALDIGALVGVAAMSARRLDDIDLPSALPADARRRIDQFAPLLLRVPSGREVLLEYRDDGTVVASVKLQEVFGLAESPRVGPAGVPVTFALLAPNGRPVQVTRDLRSFWERGYQDVRKELRGRYPKHPWPDDPWTATPTARTTRRSR
jgi:ATP-dependent helicase HrpB